MLFVMQMPRFVPEIADPRLPPGVHSRLNFLLKERGARLLAEQTGLVVEIARAVQKFGVGPADGLPQEEPGPRESSSGCPPGSLAATVLEWLNHVDGADMQVFAPVVVSALQSRLAPYDI